MKGLGDPLKNNSLKWVLDRNTRKIFCQSTPTLALYILFMPFKANIWSQSISDSQTYFKNFSFRYTRSLNKNFGQPRKLC